MKLILIAFSAAMLIVAASAAAQTNPAPAEAIVAQPTTTAPMIDGEVRKVDKEQGKLTLKHGPITNLEMPGMTMVFRVKDPAMLDKVKAGDKVRFTADKVEGTITVTAIEAVQ